MPQPRFQSLSPERRAAILDAACEELAAHGFEKASTNRIIARAGISKGALYYYFDGKWDLFATALRESSERVAAALGVLPPARDAAEFWSNLEALYQRIAVFFAQEPALAGLLKAALSPSAGPAVAPLLAELTERLRASFAGFLAEGVALGAVRDDVPLSLLADCVIASGEAHDRWVLSQPAAFDEAFLAESVRTLFGLHLRLAAPLELVHRHERPGEGS